MARLHLNRNRPYGTVFGWEGVSFQQDGRHFRHDGTIVGDPIDGEPDLLTTSVPPKGTPEETDWLKSQLQIYGEPFTTPAAARRFLAGKDD